MKKHWLLMGGLLLAGCSNSVSQSEFEIHGPELEQKFAGHRAILAVEGRDEVVQVRFNRDGTGTGIIGQEIRPMEWEVTGASICIDDPGRLGDPEDCVKVYWRGPKDFRLVRFSPNGEQQEFIGRMIDG